MKKLLTNRPQNFKIHSNKCSFHYQRGSGYLFWKSVLQEKSSLNLKIGIVISSVTRFCCYKPDELPTSFCFLPLSLLCYTLNV